jgi:hypothetical protein
MVTSEEAVRVEEGVVEEVDYLRFRQVDLVMLNREIHKGDP